MKIAGFLLICFLIASCGISSEDRKDFEKYYNDLGYEGCIVIYNQAENKYLFFNRDKCNTRYTPASTFKVFNSMVALQTEAVVSIDEKLPWDQILRQSQHANNDHNMKSAFKYSVVWFYQEMARRVGKEKMQKFLNKVNYGNQKIGDYDIDEFWLNGTLKITPLEQVDFLREVYSGELPFKKQVIEDTKRIMIEEKTPKYKLYAKTGMSDDGSAWYVGWYEIKDNVLFFANHINYKEMDIALMGSRKLIVKKIMSDVFGIE